MKNIVNLNKHDISLFVSGVETVFEPSGMVASVSTKEVVAESVSGYPCVRVEYGEVVGLPPKKEGVVYIVNMLVLERAPGDRDDLIAPDTGPTAIRESGQVKHVTRFKRKLPFQSRD